MATSPSPARMRSPFSCFWTSLCLIVLVAVMSRPIQVTAGRHSGPSSLEVYVHQNVAPPNATTVVAVSPSAASGGPPLGFGSIAVASNVVRNGAAADSPVLGTVYGEASFGIDLSITLSFTFVLSTPKYTGSISVQGVTDVGGDGEVGITTGTGDFRWARGYSEITGVYAAGGISVFKSVFYIKYD